MTDLEEVNMTLQGTMYTAFIDHSFARIEEGIVEELHSLNRDDVPTIMVREFLSLKF